MGIRPASRSATLVASLSTHRTSLPRSANTAPVTRPTYPVPTTQMFISNGGTMIAGREARGEKELEDWRTYAFISCRRRPVVVAVVAQRGPSVADGVRQ